MEAEFVNYKETVWKNALSLVSVKFPESNLKSLQSHNDEDDDECDDDWSECFLHSVGSLGETAYVNRLRLYVLHDEQVKGRYLETETRKLMRFVDVIGDEEEESEGEDSGMDSVSEDVDFALEETSGDVDTEEYYSAEEDAGDEDFYSCDGD